MWYGGVLSGSVFYATHKSRWFFSYQKIRRSFKTEEEAERYKIDFNNENLLCVNKVRNVDHSTMEMQLIGGKTTLFDTALYPRIQGHRWYFRELESGYQSVVATISGHYTYMHILIFGANVESVDHINRNRLDNRLVNLRDGSNGINDNNRKLMRTNKTGFNGICLRLYNGQEAGWRVVYQDRKKTKTKGFAFSRFGSKMAALEAAQQFRATMDLINHCSNGIEPDKTLLFKTIE